MRWPGSLSRLQKKQPLTRRSKARPRDLPLRLARVRQNNGANMRAWKASVQRKYLKRMRAEEDEDNMKQASADMVRENKRREWAQAFAQQKLDRGSRRDIWQ